MDFIFSIEEEFTPMRSAFGRSFILSLVVLAFAAPVARGQETLDDLRRAVASLQADVARLQAQGADEGRLAELQRRIDLLAAEIEKSRTGGATEAAPLPSASGMAPAASKVYGIARGVSIGGYGEALYTRPSKARQDGSPSREAARMDFLRSVLYVGYKWNDKVLLNSEIEIEHATTGEGDEERGEVALEFGYLDFRPRRELGLRAGMVLVPMGFTNELHEPPIFHGTRRPEVESAIIPTTWSENGAGVFGEAGHFNWRAYVVSGLSSAGFDASGIREGRQAGSNSLAENLALSGRVDFTGVPGLLVGGSFFTGKSGQGASVDGRAIGGRVDLFDVHAQYERRGLQLRALAAWGRVGDAALIDAANGLEGAASVGERQYGYYAQAAFDVMSLRPAGEWAVVPFVRYERLDTQHRVPAGFAKDPANDRTLWTLGVGVKPIPHVVLKADYQWRSDKARTGTNQFGLGIGYLF